MKPTKVIFSRHIHSSFSSFSSGDKTAKIALDITELDFKLPKPGQYISSKKFPMLNEFKVEEVFGDKRFKAVDFENDETFYQLALRSGRGIFGNNYSDTDEFKALIDLYNQKGWQFKLEVPEQDSYYRRKQKKRENRFKKNGYVLWKKYGTRESYESLTTADFQGGFSDELFNSKGMKKYVGDGSGAFGWIGHSVRKAVHDQAIEKGLKERGLSYEAMKNWISSGDGRHFGDALEGYTVKQQLIKIDKYLNSMFNLCLIYASQYHEGTLKSTEEIRADYEEQGILLPEDNSDYSPASWLGMVVQVFAANAIIKGQIKPNKNLFDKDLFKKISDDEQE